LNTENERKFMEEILPTEGPENEISIEEVRKAVDKTKCGKATGPSGIGAEMVKALGEDGVQWLHVLLNKYGERK
jgi:hypothetical protein